MLYRVSTAEAFAKIALSWLRRHRLEVADALSFCVAVGTVGRFITTLPFPAVACALFAAIMLPSRPQNKALTRTRAFLSGMSRRLVLLAAVGIAWLYFWNLSAKCLWLGPIWIGIAWIASWDWSPFLAWARMALAWIERNRSPRAEGVMRIAIVLALPFWLMRGFLAPYLQGGADAGWYGAVLADTMEQVRSGVFPVWAGQSAFQFNGAISPVRIAPAFNYIGALLDTVSLHSLGPVALLNLMLTAVAVTGTVSAYLCLRALLPGRRWLAVGLTVLFMACPGVLGIAYNGDLYMSWTTLPLIPLIFLGTVFSFRPERERQALLLLGVSLGLCWWAHPPIALWALLLAGCAQVARVSACRGRSVQWGVALQACLIFGAIAAYPIGSVLFYPPQQGQHMSAVQLALPGVIVEVIRDAFPGTVLPMSAVGRSPGDFQFGYGLWALLFFCLYYEFRNARLDIRVLLVEAAFLAVLLLPIPVISFLAWKIVPAFIRNPTGNWAAPRLYLPMAAATVFAVAAVSGTGLAERSRRGRLLAILVAIGCVWSLPEAGKFAAEARVIALDPTAMIDKLSPENLQLTRYSYGMFPRLPSTFTHGVTDPQLENHLLSRDSFAPMIANADAALTSGRRVASGWFVKRRHGDSDFIELESPLHIEPGLPYLLQLVVQRPEDAIGVLQITGRDFFREYGLPEHGGAKAFGVGGDHSSVIPIWTTKGAPEELRIRFFPSPPLTLDQGLQFANEVRLLEYDPSALPIRVISWIPYAASIQSRAPAWLETPRMYQPGYAAWVDDAPALVSKSPDGFVCVAVPAGKSSVRLSYVPPTGLRLLFWLSFLSSAGVVPAMAASWILRHLLAGASGKAKLNGAH